jgi:SAM-dependent methyltransferase
VDVVKYNRRAWDVRVAEHDQWTLPVAPEVIEKARQGDWSVVLTPIKAVPASWLGDVRGKDVLGVASGGGQQMPVFAAAGANTTSFDNSPAQLAQDAAVAERDALEITTVLGDMADLSAFGDATFDLVFHPVSNCFVPDPLPVWREAFRVLRPGGRLLVGFCQPLLFMFDDTALHDGEVVVRHKLPYADADRLDDEQVLRYMDKWEPLVFGHTLAAQIGGQCAVGFELLGLYEDRWSTDNSHALDKYSDSFAATVARKPR